MRIAIVSPLPSEDNSFTYLVRTGIEREAVEKGFSFDEISFRTKTVPENSVSVIYHPHENELLRAFRQRIQLPSFCNKLGIDVLIQMTGMQLQKNSIKQIHAISPGFYNIEFINRRFERSAFNNRWKIFNDRDEYLVASDRMHDLLREELKMRSNRISVFHSAENIQPLDWNEKENLNVQVSAGTGYFYSDARFAEEVEIVELLKAFSVFKKWQQSSMQLVLRLQTMNALDEKISNYKYREDVQVTTTDDSLPAAYAIVQPFNDVNVAILRNASLHNIPAIVTASDLLPKQQEMFLVSEKKVEYIGQAMIALYKNEQRRNDLGASANAFYANEPVTYLIP